eukprot:jgi/Psemu1/291666/fgenesh1_pg.770_\
MIVLAVRTTSSDNRYLNDMEFTPIIQKFQAQEIEFSSNKVTNRLREDCDLEMLSVEEVFATDEFNRNDEIAREIASNAEYCENVSHVFFKRVMSLIKGLDKLRENADSINVKEVVKLTIDVAMMKISLGSSREHLHWAPTQSGKTAFKAVKICVYLTMNIPVVLLTKGKKESEELYEKITSYLEGSRFEHRIFSVYENETMIWDEFMIYEEASVLIIPDTFQQINRTYDILTETLEKAECNGFCCAGCALILDEADAVIHRSEEEDQKNEKALKKFVNKLNPFLVKVTATPIPTLSQSIDKKPIITTSNKIIKDYVGVANQRHDDLDPESMMEGFGLEYEKYCLKTQSKKRFQPKFEVDKKSSSLALFPNQEGQNRADILQNRTKFPSVWNRKIPYFNKQCIRHLRQEINQKNAKGMLTLIDTCPWVTKTNTNIFLQASGVQDYFYEINNTKLIAIVVHAHLIFYRLPGHKYSFQCKRSLGDLIEKIDTHKTYGLKMPIVVFGYYAMKRSRSFRSNNRVPTSMIMLMGDSQSNENIRQAGGRPTFKGLKVLKRNRSSNTIRMLCPKADFDIIQKYDPLVLEIIRLYQNQQLSWKEIISELCRSSENYFVPHSKRKTGNFVPGSGSSSKTKRKTKSKTKRKHQASFPQALFETFRSMRNETSDSDMGLKSESEEGTKKPSPHPESVVSHPESEIPPKKAPPTNSPEAGVEFGETCSETLVAIVTDTSPTVRESPSLPDTVPSSFAYVSSSIDTESLPEKRKASCDGEEATTKLQACKKQCKHEEGYVDLMDSEDEDDAVELCCGYDEEDAIDLT